MLQSEPTHLIVSTNADHLLVGVYLVSVVGGNFPLEGQAKLLAAGGGKKIKDSSDQESLCLADVNPKTELKQSSPSQTDHSTCSNQIWKILQKLSWGKFLSQKTRISVQLPDLLL